MVKGTGLKKRRPLFRLIPCTFPSPSSAPSRLSASILCRLPVFPPPSSAAYPSSSFAAFSVSSSAPFPSRPLRLPVFVLSCLPVSILCAFHIPNPPISLSTHLTPSPPRPLSRRIHHLTNHPLARAKTSGLTTIWGGNAVSPDENPPD